MFFIDPNYVINMLGFSIFCFEGVGIVLPISQITAEPEKFPTILAYVFATITLIYIAFGMACSVLYGDMMDRSIITSLFPNTFVAWLIRLGFSLNLIFSYPLVLYPAHNIIEYYLYSGWSRSRKR